VVLLLPVAAETKTNYYCAIVLHHCDVTPESKIMSRSKDIAQYSGKGGLLKVLEVVSENLEICFSLPKWQHYTPLEIG